MGVQVRENGLATWYAFKDKSGHMTKYFYDSQLSDEQRETIRHILSRTKGVGNSELALILTVGGVDEDTIVNILEKVVESKNIRYDKVFINGNERERCHKKHKGQIKTEYDVSETYIGRILEKLKESLPELFTEEQIPTSYVNRAYDLGDVLRSKGFLIRQSPWNNGLTQLALFVKYEEKKRKAIVDNEVTKAMVVNGGFLNWVPEKITMKESDWVKKQVLSDYDDLYGLTQVDGLEETAKELFPENPSTIGRARTISKVGYSNCIRDAKSVATLDAARIALEAMGIAVIHWPHKYSGDDKKGYKRLLAKILQNYKQFDKLLKQGFDPDIARETIIGQLDFWCKDGCNTDGHWSFNKRKDWVKPEKVEQKVKQPKAKKKVATIEDLKALGLDL